jgi:hypothetical protein
VGTANIVKNRKLIEIITNLLIFSPYNGPNQLCSKRGAAFAAAKWRAMFAVSAAFELLGF